MSLVNIMGTLNFHGKKLFAEFRWTHTSTSDAERCEHSTEVAKPKTNEKIHELVFANQEMKVHEIVAMDNSHDSMV